MSACYVRLGEEALEVCVINEDGSAVIPAIRHV